MSQLQLRVSRYTVQLSLFICKEFSCFLSVFRFFPRNLKGSEEKKKTLAFGWLSLFLPKKGEEDHGTFPVLLFLGLLKNQGKTSKTSRIFLTFQTLKIPVKYAEDTQKDQGNPQQEKDEGNKNTKEKKDKVELF